MREEASWPGGWYVYDNVKVEGPFTASQAFTRDAVTEDGKPVLVSRKGFTQWYALKDLAEIFKVTESLGQRVEQEKVDSLVRAANALAATAPQVSAPDSLQAPQKVIKKHVGPSPASAPAPSVSVESTLPVQHSTLKSEVGEPSESITAGAGPEYVAPGFVTEARSETRSEQKKLLQEYFFVRGRLRLGKIRNPWAAAFFGVPASVGLFWPIWVHNLLKEIYYHAANKAEAPFWIVALSVIPGLHFFAIYKLASLLRAMEIQNRYKSISPAVAALFGIFPPFALAYLQDGANRHWMLHARHAGAKVAPAA